MNFPKIWAGQRWERIQKQSLSCPNLWVLIIGFIAGEQVQKELGAFYEPVLEIRKKAENRNLSRSDLRIVEAARNRKHSTFNAQHPMNARTDAHGLFDIFLVRGFNAPRKQD
jgi:hypothetical protein